MTVEQLLTDYFTMQEMCKLMGDISVRTLENKISAGQDMPPYTGKGKSRRFPKAEYMRWEKSRMKMSKVR